MPNTKKKAQSQKHRKHSFLKSLQSIIKFIVFGFNRFATSTEERSKPIEVKIFKRKVTYIGFLAIMLTLIIILVLALNNRSVGVERESIIITGLADDLEGYRILLISDLGGRSFGQDQSALLRTINAVKYDMAVFVGDMIGANGDPNPFYSLLEGLSTSSVYFVAGDSDPSPILDKPRDNSAQTLTLNQMVYADWVLGAIERGAVYVDAPTKVTVRNSTIWLMPEITLNLNVTNAYNLFKEELEQETESLAYGVLSKYDTLPLTNYRHNVLSKCNQYINSVSPSDLVIMLAHEPPLDTQIMVSQDVRTEQELKDYYAPPDLILSGHYCGGDWKFPALGAIFISSSLSERFGWFPDQSYVQGLRSVGGTLVYVTPGLSTSGDTLFKFRFMNPPQATHITLTGELPTSFLD